MQAKEIRDWCLEQPRAKVIRATMEDGSQQKVDPPKPGRNTWAQISRTLAALEPVLLEAFGDDDKLLRAMRDDDEGDQGEEYVHPALPPNADQETQRLHHFSTLLSAHSRFAVETAFRELSSMFATSMQNNAATLARLERVEANLHREQRDRLDDLYDFQEQAAAAAAAAGGATGPVDFKQQMMEKFFMSAWEAHEKKAQNGASNGKAQPNGKGKPS